jgi:hypothetical protein
MLRFSLTDGVNATTLAWLIAVCAFKRRLQPAGWLPFSGWPAWWWAQALGNNCTCGVAGA